MSRTGFSAAARESAWSALGEEAYDLLVIGGGITGVGVARDAAGRGLRVALVEAGDIADGTSSRSSRLVHGGLRYLETFEFGLVFEALSERRRLLELAPHLVRPLPFIFPVYRGDPTGLLKLTAGMWLYELLSLFRSPHRHRMFARRGVLEREPNLRADDLVGGALYHDAQVDDARLTLAVARGAHEAGANVVTRARVVAMQPGVHRMGSVRLEDTLTGREVEARARVVLNATGPWSDRVRRLADPEVAARLRTTKGAHIVVDRRRVGNRNAIIFRSSVDGRVMFVLPWRDFAYIGTTDTEYAGDPADAAADAADIEYLLASANAIFPAARLGPDDVLSTWAGVRPLLAPDASREVSESATSREHSIWRDASGLLNVAGGKLTTYRSMAAATVDAAAAILTAEFDVRSGQCYTEFLPLPGAPDDQEAEMRVLEEDLRRIDLPTELAHPLWRRYGSEVRGLLELISAEPDLRQPIVEGRPYLRGEVVWAVREELALTIEDVLRRRLQLFYDEEDGGLAAAPRVAEWMLEEDGIGWSDSEIAMQLEGYAGMVRDSRPTRVP
ncbi:MAG TPA: glycerol-3-phosphate dehydrogenase [Longimicrobiaceae bacterium]|nr:glycerol-3-phosphate dehydrogenase [Longimicrobiaceae bacterium]